MLAAEEAKKDLSRLNKTRLMLTHAGQTLPLELTRDDFERMTAELLNRSRLRVAQVIADADLNWGQVQEVLAVGGSSRMPMVLRMLRELTGKEPNCSLPPGEAVAHGAAIHAAIKAVDVWRVQTEAAAFAAASGTGDAPAVAEPAVSGDEAVAESTTNAPSAPSDPFAGIEGAAHEHSVGDIVSLDDDWEEEPARPLASVAIGAESNDAMRDELLRAVLADETIDLAMTSDPSRQYDPNVQETLRRMKKTDVNAHSLGVIVTRSEGGRGKSVQGEPAGSDHPDSGRGIDGRGAVRDAGDVQHHETAGGAAEGIAGGGDVYAGRQRAAARAGGGADVGTERDDDD